MDWIVEELACLSLGDKCLDQRAEIVLAQLNRNSTVIITYSALVAQS